MQPDIFSTENFIKTKGYEIERSQLILARNLLHTAC